MPCGTKTLPTLQVIARERASRQAHVVLPAPLTAAQLAEGSHEVDPRLLWVENDLDEPRISRNHFASGLEEGVPRPLELGSSFVFVSWISCVTPQGDQGFRKALEIRKP